MIDPAHATASWFLLVAPALFLVFYGLPLLLAPIRWARVFRRQADDSKLTLYFGRCLGGVAIAIVVCCFQAAPHPATHAILFRLVALVGAAMTGVHVGA